MEGVLGQGMTEMRDDLPGGISPDQPGLRLTLYAVNSALNGWQGRGNVLHLGMLTANGPS